MQKHFPMTSLFVFIMIFGSLISISSHYWFLSWIGLELNMIGFLPLMVNNNFPEKSESAMKYFIMQSLGSVFILVGSIYLFLKTGMWDIYMKQDSAYNNLLTLGLLLKLGAAPFHFWVPSVMAGLNWLTAFMLITWQKVAPLLLLIYFLFSKKLIIVSIMLSALIGSIGGLNQVSVRPLLAYSSITHLSWILSASLMSIYYSVSYFILYVLISISLFLPLAKSNYYNMKVGNTSFMMIIIFVLLSLSGMPPTLGFMNKIMVLFIIMSNNNIILPMILILSSMISLCFYLSLGMSLMLKHFWKSNSHVYTVLSEGEKMIYSLSLILNVLGGFLMMYEFTNTKKSSFI